MKWWLGVLGLMLAVMAVGLAGGLAGEWLQVGGALDETGGKADAGTEKEAGDRQGAAERPAAVARFDSAEGPGMKLELEAVDLMPRDFARSEEGPKVGRPAPDFTLSGLDGKTYQLAAWQGEKPVVVNFWASWCPPCEMEAPDLVYLYEKYKDDVVFLAVNLTNRDTLADARAFSERHSFAFPVLLDEKGTVGRDYQVLSIPTTYFIDKDGIIQQKLFGITTRGRLEAMVQALLEKS